MKSRWTLVATLVTACSVFSAAMAEDTKPAAKAPKTTVKNSATVAVDAPSPAQLQARMHRTLASLLEAQAAEEPNQERIAKLQAQIAGLQNQLQAQRQQFSPPIAAARYGRPGMGRDPWGGPRMGYGRGRGGPGWGYGRGGAAMGRPAGYGPGPGRGGRGWGAGPGRGLGRGWFFIDENQNGVCDYFEKTWGAN